MHQMQDQHEEPQVLNQLKTCSKDAALGYQFQGVKMSFRNEASSLFLLAVRLDNPKPDYPKPQFFSSGNKWVKSCSRVKTVQ
jgi:hypothetical protein